MGKIGLITIGQSPRDDVVPEMRAILGREHTIVEAGALDGYTLKDILEQEVLPYDNILVSRMRDGTEVKITKRFVVPLIQKRISKMEREGIGVIIVLCTGKFPEFRSNTLVVTPSEFIRGVVEGSIRKGRLGVIYPAEEQTAKAQDEWGGDRLDVYADVASPYGSDEEIERLADRLSGEGLDLILLNCMGFNGRMKRLIWERTGKPVIQANALVARVLKELII
jgi:protein AroM